MKPLTDHDPVFEECIGALEGVRVDFPCQHYFQEEKRYKGCPYGLGLKRVKDPLTMYLVLPMMGEWDGENKMRDHIYEFNLRDCVYMEFGELYKGMELIRDALLGFVRELDEAIEKGKSECLEVHEKREA